MDLTLLILFSKQVSNFLSSSNFVTKSIKFYTKPNFMIECVTLCWTRIWWCKAFWKQQPNYAFLNFMLYQILRSIKFYAVSNLMLHQILRSRQVSSVWDWLLDKKTRQKTSRQNSSCGFQLLTHSYCVVYPVSVRLFFSSFFLNFCSVFRNQHDVYHESNKIPY